MPPQKSKAKSSEEDAAEHTPVRRSTRTRRSVVQGDNDEVDAEPSRKRARSSRAAASTTINYGEQEDSNEPVNDLKNDEFDPTVERDLNKKETPKTPVKTGRGRGRKVSEHKDTPYPKSVPSGRASGRTRKRRGTSETVGEVDEEAEVKVDSSRATKKSKLESPDSELGHGEEETSSRDESKGEATTPTTLTNPKVSSMASEQTKNAADDAENKSRLAHNTPAVDIVVTNEDDDKGKVQQGKSLKQETQSKDSSVDHDNAVKTSDSESSVTNGNLNVTAKVKQPIVGSEGNVKTSSTKKDLTVASVVNASEADSGGETTKAALEKLENPDIVAMQKSTPVAANVAETCGFKVFGDGSTRLLLKMNGSTTASGRIEVKGPPETQSLILLALSELEEVSSKSNKKRVEEYLASNCAPTDEFTVVTLSINGKVVTFVNVQLESKNYAVSSLLIGCLMRKLDSRPHAFILTGYMPYVRPGTPAYELLRDGYFGNHSIETLQKMRDIKMDDEEELNKGLIDFLWKAYQHSRPWMRSVYETVLDGESVLSATEHAVIWYSTEGVEAVKVLNHARVVKADLAIRGDG